MGVCPERANVHPDFLAHVFYPTHLERQDTSCLRHKLAGMWLEGLEAGGAALMFCAFQKLFPRRLTGFYKWQ